MDRDLSTRRATPPPWTKRRLSLMIALLLVAAYSFFGYFIIPKIEASWKTMRPEGWELRLMPAVRDVGSIPIEGDHLFVVADVDHVLHFRALDSHGRRVVDTDETRLTSMAARIGALRNQLAELWPPQRPTWKERLQVNAAVASIVGYTAPAQPTWVAVLVSCNHFLMHRLPRLLVVLAAVLVCRRWYLTAKRRPRRLQIGLGTVLVAVAIFAVAIASLNAWLYAPYRAERHAADALRRLDGRMVTADRAPRWLRSYVGKNILNMEVVTVADLSHSKVTDADLVYLRAFRYCWRIDLSDTQVGNGGLIHVKNRATRLDLSRTRVTDVSVLLGERYETQLSSLKLSGNQIVPLAHTEIGWSPLHELDLSDTNADDATLKSLPDALVNLADLDLCGTNVTDNGLLSLLRMEGLKNLNLIDTKVTPQGVANLKSRWRYSSPLAILTGTQKKPAAVTKKK